MWLLIKLLLCGLSFPIDFIRAASKTERHSHNGTFTPFDGRHVSFRLNYDQLRDLDAGKAVSILITFHLSIKENCDDRGMVQDVEQFR
jgi:hypothetical protein